MPERSDENIRKIKERLQTLGQKAHETIGPEKTAAIQSAIPAVKSAARGAAIKSLRAFQALCAAGADKLEKGAEAEPSPSQQEQKVAQSQAKEGVSRETPQQKQSRATQKASAPREHAEPLDERRPQSSVSSEGDKREIIRPRSNTHARRTFTWFGVVLSLLAAGALLFSGVMLLRILRPLSGRPDDESAERPVVAQARPSASAGIVRLTGPGATEQNPAQDTGKASQESSPSAASAQPDYVKITFGTEKNIDGVNVRDGHFTRGTRVVGKVPAGNVKLLEVWQGKNQYPWYRIEAKDVTGWVYGRYVETPPQKPAQSGVPEMSAGNERAGRVTRDGVNVRDGHSTKDTRVLTRMNRQEVTVLESWQPEGTPYPWYRIRLENGEGWIYGRYVELK